MKFYSIGKFSKLIGKNQQTLRNWDKLNILKPHHITDSGYRYYSQEQVNHFFGFTNKQKEIVKKVVGYCRVSSNKQKDDLQRQIDNIKTYMTAKGYAFDIISDIGSGINYNKKGVNQLIDMILNSEIEKIIILYKDRLLRFGYELIENLCNKFGNLAPWNVRGSLLSPDLNRMIWADFDGIVLPKNSCILQLLYFYHFSHFNLINNNQNKWKCDRSGEWDNILNWPRVKQLYDNYYKEIIQTKVKYNI